jgi:ribulose-phosphate 3-epimerase
LIKIAPSILSANFSRLGDEIKEVEMGGAHYIHVDVMDGHFVPNITIGPPVVESIRLITDLPLDVHLMIDNPDLYINDFAWAGADIISVHAEACPHLHRTIQLIKSHNIKAGVVLCPATPISQIEHVLDEVDLVLIMTVNPGFGGQAFIESMVSKVEQLAKLIDDRNLTVEIEVDGGINEQTAQACVKAGANVLVAGSAIYKADDRKSAIESLLDAVKI